jgi:hypothetical protein
MQFRPILVLVLGLGMLTGCANVKVADLAAYLPADFLPAMQWDAHPEAATWTASALTAVGARDADLAGQVPSDIATYCPSYEKASLLHRRAFWVGLMSATAKYESSHNPKAVGGGGRYIGLMQISPSTARSAGCAATSASSLKDGTANLECAIQIFAPHVGEDGQVAGSGNRGVARDWGPWKKKSTRAAIAAWTSAQSYCQS